LPFNRVPFYAKFLIHGGENIYSMFDNIRNETNFERIEPPLFENEIMNEEKIIISWILM
jgi:hypothetical protein